jgi:3-dehydroquinate dehydratase / shikimate dehydrogenase
MTRPLLCVTVTAPTTAELRRRRDAIVEADLVELRLDSVRDPDVAGALEGRRHRVIVTCRPVWEGGGFAGSEDERRAFLAGALAQGAEFVDVEWRAQFDTLLSSTAGRRVIVSAHDFEGVPADLAERVTAMRATGAEVVKVAVTTARLSDCVPLLEAGHRLGGDGRLVLLGMGEAGIATRVLPGRFGSAWTYAGDLAAVGQVTVSTLLDEFRFRSLTDATEVYGLTGAPIAHSVSPAMHNAAFAAAGLDAVYLPFRAASADDFMAFGRAIGLKGASVTVPFKVGVFDRVDEVSDAARRIGAINTVKVIRERWVGANTDVTGFTEPLRGRLSLPGARAAVLGAGGAARAVVLALASAGASITIHAREADIPEAHRIAAPVDARVAPWRPTPGSWDLLVNCTPIGMYPNADQTPVAAEDLTGRFVYDLVYNPPSTRLLLDAAAQGCETIGGLEMLVSQAVEQFQWWTGVRPDAAVMRAAAEARLKGFAGEGR